MTKYIIGTMSELDLPLTPSMSGEVAISLFLRRISHEDRVKERKEVLSTNIKDINNFAGMIEDVLKQDFVVVLGNDNKIKENKDIFKKLENVFN